MPSILSQLKLINDAVVAGGMIRGTITVDGYPKDQATFNRVSGYVEQVLAPLFKTASFIGSGDCAASLPAALIEAG